jgi:deoxyribodipyrimidine photo-lyase
MDASAIVLFQADLRLADNKALFFACKNSAPIIPVFIYSPEDEGAWAPGAASRWWLHHSLSSLKSSLAAAGANLVIRRGPFAESVNRILAESGARSVYCNQRFEPAARRLESEVEASLAKLGVDFHRYNSSLLFHPELVRTSDDQPYKVFTPYYNRVTRLKSEQPLPRNKRLNPASVSLDSLTVSDLDLLPRIAWDEGLMSVWTPGEAGAQKQLRKFLSEGLALYAAGRDRPDKELVSRMSPYLHFGEISAQTIWQEVVRISETTGGGESGSEKYLRELVWREFAYHLLYHFPDTAEQPLRQNFEHFPWRRDAGGLKAWQLGMTGYPIVDAGMRELWKTGWMHNRVRMIVASFLVKDLLIDWREGARWFWDTLVDADLANNTLGWQWTAGCGADAAPFFRVFNPVLQGEKFDPDGNYVRKWLPELAKLPATMIHKPWEMPADVLGRYGVTLGRDYPEPIVDHSFARQRALLALAEIKGDQPGKGRLKKV